jgi:hypothetical protein
MERGSPAAIADRVFTGWLMAAGNVRGDTVWFAILSATITNRARGNFTKKPRLIPRRSGEDLHRLKQYDKNPRPRAKSARKREFLRIFSMSEKYKAAKLGLLFSWG